jgi:hypothetical protein
MPHTPGRKKLAAKDEASFAKRKRGSGAPPRLRCIAAGAVACHETVSNLGRPAAARSNCFIDWIAKWSRSISIDGHPMLRKKRWAFAERLTIASKQVYASATRLSRRQPIHGRSAMSTMMARSRRSWISMFSRLARTNLTTNTRLR